MPFHLLSFLPVTEREAREWVEEKTSTHREKRETVGLPLAAGVVLEVVNAPEKERGQEGAERGRAPELQVEVKAGEAVNLSEQKRERKLEGLRQGRATKKTRTPVENSATLPELVEAGDW